MSEYNKSLIDTIYNMNRVAEGLNALYIQNPNIKTTIYFDLFHKIFNEIIQTSSFKDAIKIIYENDNIDIILTNIIFPASETIEFLKTIKNKDKSAKIVVISDRYFTIQQQMDELGIRAFSECLDVNVLLQYIESLTKDNKPT